MSSFSPRATAKSIAARLIGRPPPFGAVRMGDLARVSPIDGNFGYGRGTPVDRYYVEAHLARFAADISGRAFEVGDAAYCRRFGTGITQQDVLHALPGNPEATIVGDMSVPGVLPSGAFDAMILTQTLQFVYDVAGAIRAIDGALAPGGVALVTVPGISPIDRFEWRDRWFWFFTEHSVRRLFAEHFGGAVEIETHGNVYAATCFLHGLALEEIETTKLDTADPALPVIIAVRAVKA